MKLKPPDVCAHCANATARLTSLGPLCEDCEIKSMNYLQTAGIVSDLCVVPDDIAVANLGDATLRLKWWRVAEP